MSHQPRILIVACTLALGTLGIPVPATTQGVGLDLPTEVSWAYEGAGPVSLYNLPDGTGRSFAEAVEFGSGSSVDATISLTIYDGFGNPIANFPAEDIWLRSLDDGMVACNGGAAPDGATDATGTTSWSSPLLAGGNSETLCMIIINGDAITSSPGLPLHFNSADMNGDGSVNLTDAGLFTGHLSGPLAYAADFNFDNVVNVMDAGFLAAAMGKTCP